MPMNKISRNEPCPCGSGKKYKKCCQASDGARVTKLDAATVDIYRPAALPVSNNLFVPAIACLKEKEQEEDENEKCLFILFRPSRALGQWTAIDEATADLDSQPDAGEGVVGPGCLRYLDKIGYRTMPAVEFEHLKFAPEPESDNEVCERCGQVHSSEYDDDFDNDEIPDHPGFDDEQIESEAAEAAAFIRRLPSIPIEQLDASEPADTFVRLREEGLTREEAIVMVLETMVKEVTMPGGESKPDATRLMSALARLAEESGT